MLNKLAILLVLALVSSCALNKLFLVPMPLHDEDSFTRYVEKYEDTLTLSFQEDRTPAVVNSKGETMELPYTVESVYFDSESGNRIHGWHFYPKSDFNGKVLYFLHGNAGNVVYQYALATPFAEAGYQVYMIDYSGFGFSEGKATRKNVLLDGLSGLKNLRSRMDAEQTELYIYGQSLGGHLAAVVATRDPENVRGLILEGAFSSHKDIAAKHVPVLGRIFTREMYSAKKSLPEFTQPVLVIHSTEDQTIPYKEGVVLFEAANEPKSMYTIDKPHIRGPIYYLDSISAKIGAMHQ